LQFSTVDRSHLSDYAASSGATEIYLVGLRRSLVRTAVEHLHSDLL
jgi:hypothetical protein